MKCADAKCVLRNLGFELDPQQKGGSHEKWRKEVNGQLWKVTLDCHHGEVGAKDVRSMMSQAGVSKKEWWDAL